MILGNSLGSPSSTWFCFLGEKTMKPNITNKKFNILKVDLITAAILVLQNWKKNRCPTVKE